VLVIPHLAQHGVTVVGSIPPRVGGIESRARTPDERYAAMFLGQHITHCCVAVRCAVGRHNVLCFEPLEGWEALVEFYRRLEKVDDIFVLTVLRAVAWDVESAEATGGGG
jgi:hypothetical protein